MITMMHQFIMCPICAVPICAVPHMYYTPYRSLYCAMFDTVACPILCPISCPTGLPEATILRTVLQATGQMGIGSKAARTVNIYPSPLDIMCPLDRSCPGCALPSPVLCCDHLGISSPVLCSLMHL